MKCGYKRCAHDKRKGLVLFRRDTRQGSNTPAPDQADLCAGGKPLFALQKHQVTGKFLCVSKHGLDDRIPFCASDDPHADPVADALHSKCGVCQNRGLARCPIELEHKDLCLVDMGGPLVGP